MTAAALIRVGSVIVRLIADRDRVLIAEKRGGFEARSLSKWADLCGPDSVVIDIGAYTGVYTIAARLLGAHCIAFEPMPFNRRRLQENCRLNNIDDKVNSEVVTDQIGEAIITYNPIPFTSGASLIRKNGTPLAVQGLTIDSLNLKRVDAIKIDVERAEPRVLAGARETLARCKPTLLVEVLGEDEGQAVLAAMQGLDYRHVETLDARNWIMVPM